VSELGCLTIVLMLAMPTLHGMRGKKVTLLRRWSCTQAEARKVCEDFAAANKLLCKDNAVSAEWQVGPLPMSEHLS
jgi:hypothetical protein